MICLSKISWSQNTTAPGCAQGVPSLVRTPFHPPNSDRKYTGQVDRSLKLGPPQPVRALQIQPIHNTRWQSTPSHTWFRMHKHSQHQIGFAPTGLSKTSNLSFTDRLDSKLSLKDRLEGSQISSPHLKMNFFYLSSTSTHAAFHQSLLHMHTHAAKKFTSRIRNANWSFRDSLDSGLSLKDRLGGSRMPFEHLKCVVLFVFNVHSHLTQPD